MLIDPTGYAAAQIETSPPWLQGPNGAAWNFAVGTMKDGYLEASKRAVLARFPEGAPQDALARIARTFNLDTGVADQIGIEALRSVLAAAWDAWTQAGTKAGLIARLAELGLHAEIYEAWQWAPGTPDWWKFWVVLRPVFDTTSIPRWPWDGHLWDDLSWSDAGTWDGTGVWRNALPDDWLSLIRRTIAKWKPAHAVCQNIILLQSGQTFGSRVVIPGGFRTWAIMSWLPARVAYLAP